MVSVLKLVAAVLTVTVCWFSIKNYRQPDSSNRDRALVGMMLSFNTLTLWLIVVLVH